MAHNHNARPVSGEIMTPADASAESRIDMPGSRPDIVDADYETVHAARTDAPRAWIAAGSQTEREFPGLDMLRAGNPLRARTQSASAGFWVFGTVLVMGAFWVSGGHALLGERLSRQMPSSPVGLQLAAVESRVEHHGATALLFIDGMAVNAGSGASPLPDISVNVLAHDGTMTRYFLGTNEHRLSPGARFPFSSRLVAPKQGVKSVSVTFKEFEG